jgi:hypothetical protein
MKAFRLFLLSAVVAGSLPALCPAPASADEYWPGYWGWYDNTYRPYYARRYAYSGPGYSYYAPAPAYGPAYYGPGYSGYAPYGTYYGAPAAGVGVYPGGTAVRVGPMRFGWR